MSRAATILARALGTRRTAVLVCVGLALLAWWIFLPANLSRDSIGHYGEALTLEFSNWHPPFMSVVLAGVMALGGDLELVSLFQALATVFGVWFLVTEVTATVRAIERPDGACRATGTAATILLMMPFWSPLAFYAMTLWKDAWLLVGLCGFSAVALRLWRATDPHPLRRNLAFMALVSLSLVNPLIRHNAVVLAPVMAFGVWRLARTKRPWAGVAFALLALLGGLFGARALERAIGAVDTRPFSQVMALELVGVYMLHPEARPLLAHTARHLTTDRPEEDYRFGAVSPLLTHERPIVAPEYVAEVDQLKSEYLTALRSLPLELLEVKLRAFAAELNLARTRSWGLTDILPNELGLRESGWIAARRFLGEVEGYVSGHALLRWISGVHAVWLAAAVLLWVFGAIRRRAAPGVWSPIVFVLTLALVYYASYLVAVTSPAFRFMYPATLLVQCAVAGIIGAGLSSGTARARD